MDKIINVKDIVKKRKELLIKRVENIKIEEEIVPKVAVILANNDEKTINFVKKKNELCEEIGIEQETYEISNNASEEEILSLIEKLNEDSSIFGIIIQMPVYNHINLEEIILAIDPEKDVEGMHPYNVGRTVSGLGVIRPCTPKGIITILDEMGVEIEGKNVTIVGRSILVGKPLSYMFLERNATVTICHSKTADLGNMTRLADILIVATGVPKLISEEMVKEGAVVIDVGINKLENGKVVGDVDFDNVIKRVKLITPVPGGVGLTTVLSLVENIVEMTEDRLGVKYIEYEKKQEKVKVVDKVKIIPNKIKKYIKRKKIVNIEVE